MLARKMIAMMAVNLLMNRNEIMTDETPQKDSPDEKSLDLTKLADFQFGPAWARPGSGKTGLPKISNRFGDDKKPFNGPRRDGFAPRGGKEGFGARGARPERRFDGGQRDDRNDRNGNASRNGERRFSRDRRDGDRSRQGERGDRFGRPREELIEPTAGLRVELRPVDTLLAAWAEEINKHRRVISLFEFAKVVMASRERYDLVFMKQEDGPQMFHSRKEDGSCWLTREEAVRFLWKAPWFGEFYASIQKDVEPPKGEFQGVAKCMITGDLIGPVNWHGYQPALMALHKSKFSNMPLEHFRHKIEIEKGAEVVQAWLEAVSKRTVWSPIREGAEELIFETQQEVEKDFAEHFLDKAFELTDKVFINGAIVRSHMSPGLWSHVIKLADATKKHPSMLIPNLCHGLVRHRMPIFKWKGGHHTGPSRPRTLAADTVLADRMASIVAWVKANPGKKVEMLLNELGGALKKKAPVAKAPDDSVVTADVADESAESTVVESSETTPNVPNVAGDVETKRRDLLSDLLWLCEQGYILVFADGTVNFPPVAEAPTVSDNKSPKVAKSPKNAKTPKKKSDKATVSTKEKKAKTPKPSQDNHVEQAPALNESEVTKEAKDSEPEAIVKSEVATVTEVKVEDDSIVTKSDDQ
ncbi:MAG: hypothetical protein RR506_06450 [Akkermansia sp.]